MRWALLGSLLFSNYLQASTLDDLSFLFYKNKISSSISKSLSDNEQCYPSPGSSSCVKVVCSNIPSYQCDEADEIREVTTMCKGNFGGDCLTGVFKKLPKYQYDELSEMADIATQCRNVYGSVCFDFVASKIPSYQLDERDEVIQVLNQCKGVYYDTIDCARFACSKLPSFKCDEADEILDVLNSCGR